MQTNNYGGHINVKYAFILDGCGFGLYTLNYENNKQIFCTAIIDYFHHVIDDSDRFGMDDADYDYDEIPDCVWHKVFEFFISDIVYDSVYHFDYCAVRHIYRDYIRI